MSKLENLDMTWDLDKIFPGGSESQELKDTIDTLEKELKDLAGKSAHLAPREEELAALVKEGQALWDKLREVSAFVTCLVSQNQDDRKAKLLEGKLRQLQAVMAGVMIDLEAALQQFSEEEWKKITAHSDLSPVKFFLSELRERGRDKLEADKEKLASDLAVEGYHAWSEMYHTIVGDIRISHRDKELSVGQAQNLLSTPDQSIRREVGDRLEEAFREKEHLISSTLNNLSGYRLSLYRHREWDVLKEPLMMSRISRETLETMWDVISKNKDVFTDYYRKKKEFLGLDEFGWYDRSAPLSTEAPQVSYDQGARFIVEQFHKASRDLAEFAEMALANRWVEAEDRDNKRPGGFCTSFPLNGESRVFMTYSGTSRNVATLAHELGHAYHQWALRDLPSFASRYPMTLAETASTLAEQVVSDAAIEAAGSNREKLDLLDEKISKSCTFFMDIHTRFLFEKAFYKERGSGPVSTDRINELMLEAQKEAYRDSLDHWHPRFWATRLHFYLTRVPFYNFPYTFGYLFSMGVYGLYRKNPDNFPEIYRALLRDTGSMTAEELAQKHLNVDLKKPDFWEEAVKHCVADVEKFYSLLQETG